MNKKQFNVELERIYDELYRFIYSIIGNKNGSDAVVMNTILAGKSARQMKK